MAEVETCPACGSHNLDIDELEGIIACTDCGRIVDETVVLHSSGLDDHVYVSGDGTAAAGRLLDRSGTSGRSAFGRSGDGGSARLRDTLERGASMLRIPPAVLQDARSYLEELPKSSRFQFRPHPVTAGVAIYLACRFHHAPVTLRDVSGALAVELKLLASAYRAALGELDLQVPAASIQAHVFKIGATLVAAQFPSYTEPFRQHPVVRSAQELVELLQLLDILEGHAPQAVAGVALKIACNCFMAGTGVKVPAVAVAKYVGVGPDSISKAVSVAEQALLAKCKSIPAAKTANQYNLTHFTQLLKDVYTLIPRLQQRRQ